MIFPVPWLDWENNQWIKITNTVTIRVPGQEVTIDLTTPKGIGILTDGGDSQREFTNPVEFLDREGSINLWQILIEFAGIFALSLLLGLVACHIVETAMIRMKNENEKISRHMSVWQSLREDYRSGLGGFSYSISLCVEPSLL